MKKKRSLKRECHIFRMLQANAKAKHLSFHTPGHKRGKWDITELPYSDNLAAPHGCIAKAEEDITSILGAYKSFILTDGSTSGVLSMLYAARLWGVKTLAFPLATHKSVYNGCALLGITPLVFEKHEEWLTNATWRKQADGVLCTSPDYYGNIPNLTAIRTLCEAEKKLLLIDGAHGGHLHFEKTLYAGTYADLWVDGVHKSLPALTQGAVVSARTEKLSEYLREAVNIFRTTSPSYPIMASVEYAVKYPKNERLENDVSAYAKEEERVRLREDYTKLTALFGKNAFDAYAFMQSKGIYAEFCDGNEICFYLSPATKARDFRRLKKMLKSAFERFPYLPVNELERNPIPVGFRKEGEVEWVDFTESIGKICAGNCGLFPPCTPLICVGERITEEKIELLQKADHVFGVKNGKIAVWKGEEKE